MPHTIHVQPTAGCANRRALADRVAAEFGDMSGLNVLCFLDNQDCPGLREMYGEENRGGFTPSVRRITCPPFPDYVWHLIFVDDPPSWELKQMFSELVYLHGSTCESDVGLVMTFAHELQHVRQYRTQRRFWEINSAVFQHFSPMVLAWAKVTAFNIPIELDARIVANRIAEKLCKSEDVSAYIEERISKAVNAGDLENWKFIRQLDASRPFDLQTETAQLFEKLKPYRQYLEPSLQVLKEDDSPYKHIDFAGMLSGSS
jgi:hypothetical protein